MAISSRQNTHWGTDAKKVTKWTLTDADPTGDWLELPTGADRSVHVVFAAGTGTITLQGSNEPVPTNPQTLKDPNQAALSFTVSSLVQVLEMTLMIRPVLTGGSGATVHVYLATV